MSLKGRVASSTAASLVGAALSIGASVVVARTLGPTGKGVFALVTLIPLIALYLGIFGFDSGFTFSVARSPKLSGALKKRSLRLFVVLGGGMMLVVNAGIYFGGSRLIPNSEFGLLVLANMAIPFLVLSALLQGMSRRMLNLG